jgi:peptidoglycan/LPS O-acetylase OafA/YrhL
VHPGTSVYLDLARLLAAMTVFLGHAAHDYGGIPFLGGLSAFGHDAAMVFFVLSGFVIAYVAERRERTLSDYAASRLARLYSVVAPALVLTALLHVAGSLLDWHAYARFPSDAPVWRLVAGFFFLNELWFMSIWPLSNGPFWSLGYEFWYYVLFGAAWYLRGYARAAAIVVVCSVVGPKILLLFPVWLMGAGA